MNQSDVLMDVHNHVAYVTLNRPAVHNAFNESVINHLIETFDTLAKIEDVRVVVLRGAGKSFSAGADLNWMESAASYSREKNLEDARHLARMLHSLYVLPKVTIALVHGVALGGGVGLAACCDIVVADKSAHFGLSEVKLGLIPATIAPYVLRAIGGRQARRYFQTGERFTATRAKDIGLVHELVDGQEEMEELLGGLLGTIRLNGPQAMAQAKKLCFDFDGQKITPASTEDTAIRIADIRAGEEAKEGLSAFLSKRPATWRG